MSSIFGKKRWPSEDESETTSERVRNLVAGYDFNDREVLDRFRSNMAKLQENGHFDLYNEFGKADNDRLDGLGNRQQWGEYSAGGVLKSREQHVGEVRSMLKTMNFSREPELADYWVSTMKKEADAAKSLSRKNSFNTDAKIINEKLSEANRSREKFPLFDKNGNLTFELGEAQNPESLRSSNNSSSSSIVPVRSTNKVIKILADEMLLKDFSNPIIVKATHEKFEDLADQVKDSLISPSDFNEVVSAANKKAIRQEAALQGQPVRFPVYDEVENLKTHRESTEHLPTSSLEKPLPPTPPVYGERLEAARTLRDIAAAEDLVMQRKLEKGKAVLQEELDPLMEELQSLPSASTRPERPAVLEAPRFSQFLKLIKSDVMGDLSSRASISDKAPSTVGPSDYSLNKGPFHLDKSTPLVLGSRQPQPLDAVSQHLASRPSHLTEALRKTEIIEGKQRAASPGKSSSGASINSLPENPTFLQENLSSPSNPLESGAESPSSFHFPDFTQVMIPEDLSSSRPRGTKTPPPVESAKKLGAIGASTQVLDFKNTTVEELNEQIAALPPKAAKERARIYAENVPGLKVVQRKKSGFLGKTYYELAPKGSPTPGNSK
jgi:hypothetical protein